MPQGTTMNIEPPAPISGFSDASAWSLDPQITYLNHGSFGARRCELIDHQQELRTAFEASPIEFLDRNRDAMIDTAAEEVCAFVGADRDGFGFVSNATTAIGCVLRSLSLGPGDQLVCTDHVYNGIRQLMSHVAEGAGAAYREIPVAVHEADESSIAEAVLAGLDGATLLVIDHVSSPTAIRFPIAEIVAHCRKEGILVLVDGAHAPGMVELDIAALGPDWYAANLHKWACAPPGAGFLWAAPQHRRSTHPMTVSHYLGASYEAEFGWQGTRDITPWLCAGVSIAQCAAVGWNTIRQHNHALATWMHQELVRAWDLEPLSALDGHLLGSMASVRVPAWATAAIGDSLELRDRLFCEHQVEVAIFDWNQELLMRVSAAAHNCSEDLVRLVSALESLCGLGGSDSQKRK